MEKTIRWIYYATIVDVLLLCMTTWPTRERIRYNRKQIATEYWKLAQQSPTFMEDLHHATAILRFVREDRKFSDIFTKVFITGKYETHND